MEWEWAIKHLLSKYLRGRKLAVWGIDNNVIALYSVITKYADISLFISNNISNSTVFNGKPVIEFSKNISVNPSNYYIIVLEDIKHKYVRDRLLANAFLEIEDYFDYFGAPSLPIDAEYNGVFIGKGSYFQFSLKIIEKAIKHVGRFVSINPSVHFNRNHAMNILTTADKAILRYLDKKQLELYDSIIDVDRSNTGCKVKIGNDVWIGANVFINISSVSNIGDGAIIGAGSVVTHDVPPYSIVYGIPARVQRYRFTTNQIEILQQVKWWDWEDDVIKKNAELILFPELFFTKFEGGFNNDK